MPSQDSPSEDSPDEDSPDEDSPDEDSPNDRLPARNPGGGEAPPERVGRVVADIVLMGLGLAAFGGLLGLVTGFSNKEGISESLLTSLFTFVGGALLTFTGFRYRDRRGREEGVVDPRRTGAGLLLFSLGCTAGLFVGMIYRSDGEEKGPTSSAAAEQSKPSVKPAPVSPSPAVFVCQPSGATSGLDSLLAPVIDEDTVPAPQGTTTAVTKVATTTATHAGPKLTANSLSLNNTRTDDPCDQLHNRRFDNLELALVAIEQLCQIGMIEPCPTAKATDETKAHEQYEKVYEMACD